MRGLSIGRINVDLRAGQYRCNPLYTDTDRYDPRCREGPWEWRRISLMSEQLTERARKVVVLAQEEARHFNDNYIGTEHLLLGLLREDEGVAARALSSLNVTLDEVREQVESIVGYGEEGTGGQA